MSLWKDLVSWYNAPLLAEQRSAGVTTSTEEVDPKLLSILGISGVSVGGAHVNESSALGFAAVWACVQAISQDLAALPVQVFQDRNGSKVNRKDHPVYRLLNIQANPKQTAYQFRMSMMATVLLRGEAFARIERDGRQRPVALHYHHPTRVEVLDYDGRFWYRFNGQQKVYADYDVLHLRGLSLSDGRGLSVLSAHRKTIGLGLANQNYGAGFYDKGARVDGVMKHPGKFKDSGVAERLRNQFESTYAGAGGSRVLMLEEGIDYQAISMGPKDAEFLNTHKLSKEDIASIFRVPPHKIGDLTRSTNNNIEQQSIDYTQNTMQPWAVNIEQEYRLKLFRTDEQADTKARHNFNGLLRGDSQARAAYYSGMLNTGVLSINEVRDLEEFNPIEGGDVHLVQGAMATLENISTASPATQPPPPTTTAQP